MEMKNTGAKTRSVDIPSIDLTAWFNSFKTDHHLITGLHSCISRDVTGTVKRSMLCHITSPTLLTTLWFIFKTGLYGKCALTAVTVCVLFQ